MKKLFLATMMSVTALASTLAFAGDMEHAEHEKAISAEHMGSMDDEAHGTSAHHMSDDNYGDMKDMTETHEDMMDPEEMDDKSEDDKEALDEESYTTY